MNCVIFRDTRWNYKASFAFCSKATRLIFVAWSVRDVLYLSLPGGICEPAQPTKYIAPILQQVTQDRTRGSGTGRCPTAVTCALGLSDGAEEILSNTLC